MPFRITNQEALDENLIERVRQEIDCPSSEANAPWIVEDYVRASRRYSVYVLWDKWSGVDPAERNQIVMEAYKTSDKRKDNWLDINAIFALTEGEAADLVFDVEQLKAAGSTA